jgi:glyoxylase-like metal-dependent hydrolase (beta-lactamase superfamily II)
MRIIRLPGIHHDANASLVVGKEEAILIDTGTSWYQMLQVERIKGHIEEGPPLSNILLSNRRFPFSGGAQAISEAFDGAAIHIGEDGVSALETGDFFSTWANRFDSDMPVTISNPLVDGDVFAIDDRGIECISTPGHAPEAMCFHQEDLAVLFAGSLISRADTPIRWDLPGGCLPDLADSIAGVMEMEIESLIASRGPAIKGRTHIEDVLNNHLQFFDKVMGDEGKIPKSWAKPTPTSLFLTPREPWPLLEHEEAASK